MRSPIEISNALNQLEQYQGNDKEVLLDVITNKMTSEDVFRKYMKEISDEERSVDKYYKARDAAMFLNGDINIESLFPGAEPYNPSADEKEYSSLDAKALKKLLKILSDLQKEVTKLKKAQVKFIPVKHTINNKESLISRKEAAEYIGCSVFNLSKWTELELVPAYMIGKKYYYKPSELDDNKQIKNYKSQA